MTATIRLATPADLEAVLAIQEATPELPKWSEESLAEALAGDRCRLLLAGTEEEVLGFLLWQPLPANETEILSLAVAENARRRGVAESLLRRLFALRSGEFFLEARASNAAALALYAKLGFERQGVRRAYYHHPVEDAVLMRRVEILQKDAPSRR